MALLWASPADSSAHSVNKTTEITSYWLNCGPAPAELTDKRLRRSRDLIFITIINNRQRLATPTNDLHPAVIMPIRNCGKCQ